MAPHRAVHRPRMPRYGAGPVDGRWFRRYGIRKRGWEQTVAGKAARQESARRIVARVQATLATRLLRPLLCPEIPDA